MLLLRRNACRMLLSSSQISNGVPNWNGTFILYTLTQYCFQIHATERKIIVIDLNKNKTFVVCDSLQATQPTWLGEEDLIIWQSATDEGSTAFWIKDAKDPIEECVHAQASFQRCAPSSSNCS